MARSKHHAGQTPEQQIAHVRNLERALKLRESGMTYAAIGLAMGTGKRTAQRRVERAIAGILEEPAERVRTLELGRLDTSYRRLERIVRAHMPHACAEGVVQTNEKTGETTVVVSGSVKSVIDAIKAQLVIAERRAKYLGLDAPERADVTLKTDATPAAARRVMQELFGDNVRAPVEPGEGAEAPDGLGPPEGSPTH